MQCGVRVGIDDTASFSQTKCNQIREKKLLENCIDRYLYGKS